MPTQNKDITQPSDLQAHGEGTGALRSKIPVYQRSPNSAAACNHACPAGENIQAWLGLAQEGRYAEGWQKLVEENPLPAVHGRVCYHPCEDHCNRAQVDTPVSIHAVERFLGDKALEEDWQIAFRPDPLGQKSAHRGGRPQRPFGGLPPAPRGARSGNTGGRATARRHDALWHPPYRLPRPVLDAEIQRIVNMGIAVRLNHKVTDVVQEKRLAASTPFLSPLAPIFPKKRTFRRGTRAKSSTPDLFERHGGRSNAQIGPKSGHLRRRQYGHGRRAGGQTLGLRTAHHLPPRPRTCPPMPSRPTKPWRKG